MCIFSSARIFYVGQTGTLWKRIESSSIALSFSSLTQAFYLSLPPIACTSSPYYELSPSSKTSISLPVAFSSALSWSIFAFPASPIKFGLLPSYPHIWAAAAPSLSYYLACLRAPDVSVHPTRARSTSAPRGLPKLLCVLVHKAFLPSFQSPPCFLIPRDLSSPQPPRFRLSIWLSPPPAPLWPWCVAAPMPRSSLLCMSSFPTLLSAARVCWFSPLQYSAWAEELVF